MKWAGPRGEGTGRGRDLVGELGGDKWRLDEAEVGDWAGPNGTGRSLNPTARERRTRAGSCARRTTRVRGCRQVALTSRSRGSDE